MYRIDLQTLLFMIRERNGVLETTIGTLPGLHGRCQVIVRVQMGKPVACMIKDSRGRIFEGQRALDLVMRKELDWTYREEALPEVEVSPVQPVRTQPLHNRSQAQNPPPMSQADPAIVWLQAVPCHVMTSAAMDGQNSWPRLYRSVMLLVDGHRSVYLIAQLLQQDNRKVLNMVVELIEAGFLQWRS